MYAYCPLSSTIFFAITRPPEATIKRRNQSIVPLKSHMSVLHEGDDRNKDRGTKVCGAGRLAAYRCDTGGRGGGRR